jgi:O-succinylbenzoic acid--CoA ligase
VGGLSILLRSVIYGTTAVVHERFDAGRALAELSAPGGATLVSLVPTTLRRLLDAGLPRPPRLRCALVGGAPLPSALAQRARAAGVAVSHTYGLTEAGSQVTTQPVGSSHGRGPTEDAGVPLVCTRVSVAGDGEILVAGPTVAPGSLAPDGWLHTGDLGTLDAGRLRVTGRKTNTIISGGENVAPEEVEAVLASHPAVAEALVTGRPHAEWGEALVASVVLRDGLSVSPTELQAHCRRQLAPFKVPREVWFSTDPLPRNRTGKLVRSGGSP